MNKNSNPHEALEKENTVKRNKLVDADNLSKAQVKISLAVFFGIITAITVAIFFILSEYFTIKSSIDKINFQMTDLKEEQSEIKDIIKDGSFSLVSNNDLELELKKINLDCKLSKERIIELKQLSDDNKCK